MLTLNLIDYFECFKHVNFDERQYLNDIAILKLTNEVVLSSKIQVACLPDPSQSIFPNQVGTKVYAAGWGMKFLSFFLCLNKIVLSQFVFV